MKNSKPTNTLTDFEKVVKLVNETHNDMELGTAIRSLVNQSKLNQNKPPFTDDYTQ